MARRVSARLTPAQGRRFGLTLGIAFLALAALLLWRDRETTALVAGIIGAGLLLGGLIVPTRLGPIERGWMAFAHAISKVTTPIFMAIVYYVAIVPMGVLMRMLRHNPIDRNATDDSFWVVHESKGADQMNRQF
ncbi:MAG: SxtJ family membrane protein [Gemmatimonadales bacterium]|jgi:hypothetical protein